ncbi:hypothetical protein F8M41_023718 [Gigaspora margarita]|uniref:Uncharacterized protein n=1 Tax=Gigaspora margarita TaxID=4874 RepID=A0A8H4ETG1_GIGMA|nr:hypothetical protein F8M41_023718 [Gigaspora margarita]
MIKDIGEIEETTQVQRGHGRGSCGSRNRGRGNRGRGNHGIGNLGRETSHRASQRSEERETSIEPTPNIEYNDSYLDYEREIESDIGRFTDSEYSNVLTIESPVNNRNSNILTLESHQTSNISNLESPVNNRNSNISTLESPVNNRTSNILTLESSVSNRNFNISTIESPVNRRNQMQNRLTVSDLLQMSDSDNSNDGIGMFLYLMLFYNGNYKNPTNVKKRQTNDDNEDEGDNEATQFLRKRTKKPEALKDMTNIFEVCQWLVLERPDILATANQMHNAMQTSLNSSTVTIPQPEVTIVSRNTTDDKGLARLWHEEIKCLFLRCRDPPASAIESLITKIFNYELYSNEAVEIICHSKRVLTDFRNVVEQILKRYMKGTNIDKLKRCGAFDQLIKLIKEAFKIFFNAYNAKAVKELNYLTIGCRVPSRSGKNIASGLSLTNSNNNNHT